MNIENLDFNNIDSRLDLDSFMNNVVTKFPKDENSFIFYIRGNIETGDCCLISASSFFNFGYAMFNLALQNEDILNELEKAMEAIKEYKSQLKTEKNEQDN